MTKRFWLPLAFALTLMLSCDDKPDDTSTPPETDADTDTDADSDADADADADADSDADADTDTGDVPMQDYDLTHAGAVLQGEGNWHRAGSPALLAGDVDGDGHGDVVVVAQTASGSSPLSGVAYLVYGPLAGEYELEQADVLMSGFHEKSGCCSLASAGDLDGDGDNELLIGAHGWTSDGLNGGSVYLVLDPPSGDMDLEDADHVWRGPNAGDYLGSKVDGGEDATGDGLPDLLLSASDDDEGAYSAGAVYLLDGFTDEPQGLGEAHAKLLGSDGSEGASSGGMDLCSDVTGDGIGDILVGSSWFTEFSERDARVYLVAGPVSGTVSLSSADAIFVTSKSASTLDDGVRGVGDLDGDGHGDIALAGGVPDSEPEYAGRVHIVSGPTFTSGDIALQAVGWIEGDAAYQHVGGVLDSAGDIDQDGRDDLIVGSWAHENGAAYLFHGPVVGALGLDDAAWRFTGELAGDGLGSSYVAGGRDADGDGVPDLLLSASDADIDAYSEGLVYLIGGADL